MKNKYIIGAGLVALGLFAYSRYAKKDDDGQGEESTGGGGIGGGIGGSFVNPITNQPAIVTTPTTTGGIKPVTITNPIVLSGLGSGKPTAATTSSTGAGAQSGVGIGAGISGIKPSSTLSPSVSAGLGAGKPVSATTTSTGAGATSGVSSGSGVGITMTGTAGGTVFKPFSGSEPNCKRPIYLNDLVRSWNRP
jgi:hypothetical protein